MPAWRLRVPDLFANRFPIGHVILYRWHTSWSQEFVRDIRHGIVIFPCGALHVVTEHDFMGSSISCPRRDRLCRADGIRDKRRAMLSSPGWRTKQVMKNASSTIIMYMSVEPLRLWRPNRTLLAKPGDQFT